MKLRLLRAEDLPYRVELMNRPEVYMHMGFTPPVVLDKTIGWFEKNQLDESRKDFAFLDENDNIIGFGGVTGIDSGHIKGELYTFLSPSCQGKGLGTRATYLMIRYAFEELGLHKIFSFTDEDNVASYRVNEKLGFTLEGIHREEKRKNGQFVNKRYYGILSGELPVGMFPEDIIMMGGGNSLIASVFAVRFAAYGSCSYGRAA